MRLTTPPNQALKNTQCFLRGPSTTIRCSHVGPCSRSRWLIHKAGVISLRCRASAHPNAFLVCPMGIRLTEGELKCIDHLGPAVER